MSPKEPTGLKPHEYFSWHNTLSHSEQVEYLKSLDLQLIKQKTRVTEMVLKYGDVYWSYRTIDNRRGFFCSSTKEEAEQKYNAFIAKV